MIIGSNQTLVSPTGLTFNITEQMFYEDKGYTKEFSEQLNISLSETGHVVLRANYGLPKYVFTWELVALTDSFTKPLINEAKLAANSYRQSQTGLVWQLTDNRIASVNRDTVGSFNQALRFETYQIIVTDYGYEDINNDYSIVSFRAIEAR